MLDLSFLYAGWETSSQALRYGRQLAALKDRGDPWNPPSASERRPIVVWNITRTCNLRCLHCYSDSRAKKYSGELSHEEALGVVEDLANFKVPALLFSGGEPLLREDLFELVASARGHRLSCVLSTNGTLIDKQMAGRIKAAGFSYVGISLDGIGEVHDRFRGVQGTFEKVRQAFRSLKAVDQKVGLRLTLTHKTSERLEDVFAFIERENIDRVCFYHLVPAGRGRELFTAHNAVARRAVEQILDWVDSLKERGICKEVLTVDNPCDAPFLYNRMTEKKDPRREDVLKCLKWNGGGRFSSGVGIADIDFQGDVHPDQFWMDYTLGNVRKRKFSEIWQDVSEPLMAMLKDKLPHLKGRCGACNWKEICGGGLRARAAHVTGDPMAADPACYLEDHEI